MPTKDEGRRDDGRRRPLATVRDLSEFLRVPVQTIYGWRKREARTGVRTGPPAKLIGGQLRYDWRDVDKWLAEQEVKAS